MGESTSDSAETVPKDILSYLIAQNDNTLCRLYRDTFTALTVFRSLPPLAKQYVMRLLCLDAALSKGIIQQWTKSAASSANARAWARLKVVKVIDEYTQNGAAFISLNPQFRQCLRDALCNEVSKRPDQILKPDKKPPSEDDLGKNAVEKWEQICYYMIGSSEHRPIGRIVSILRSIGLMNVDSAENDSLTAEGFRFLFQPLHTQIWMIVIGFMSGLEERGMVRDEVLTFLFRLSFLESGKDYPKAPLTPTQDVLVSDLSLFGLIYQRKRKARRFYPTKLCSFLSSGVSQTREELDRNGFIIVETAFKVFAYTSSKLQLSLLNMFVRLDVRLPNMVAGIITKESVSRAIRSGITVNQIIAYLQQYAHARMRNKSPVIPENVTDQLMLWENQRARLRVTPSVLLREFADPAEFASTLAVIQAEAAAASGARVLLKNEARQWMVVTREAKEVVKRYRQGLALGGGGVMR
eukprot:278434_1